MPLSDLFPQPAAAPQPALQMRDFGDATAIRQNIFDSVLKAAQSMPALENQQHRLVLSDVAYEEQKPVRMRDEKKAVLSGQTLSRRLRGTWTLQDKLTGQPLDSRQMTLANVPYYTNRGTFVQRGSDYTTSNQLRVRSGVFTRQKENGELEAHVNVLPGKGLAHRIFLDPEKGIFKLHIGQANLPLIPLLKAMGTPDSKIQEAWGRELYAANVQKDDPSAIRKLYTKLVGNASNDLEHDAMRQAVAKKFAAMELDPDVTRRTLKQPFDRISPEQILATTQKLLRISKGEDSPDDRDDLAYQTVMGPEDILAERIQKDKAALRNALWKASGRKNLSSMPVAIMDKALNAAIYSSGLSQPLESTNPLQIYEQQGRITRMGEGAIQSLDAVPMESRALQPSHYGFIDPVITPESEKAGVDSRIAAQTKKGSDGRLYARFLDKQGQETWKSAQDLEGRVIGFPGGDPSEPFVPAMKDGKFEFADRSTVDYVLPNMEEAFSPLSNMVPFKSAMKANRTAMAGRFLSQSLPLVNAEAPYVQSGIPGKDGVSFEDEYAKHLGAVRAKAGGIVEKVDADEILVRDPQTGKTESYDLANNFPYNRKTMLHNTATVQPGDIVQPNQLLARSNYTDKNGTAAMGLNARVAFASFQGKNYEDAISVSESFAKRATSEHLYQHPLEIPDGAKMGKKPFLALFASKYDKKTLEKLDDDGVIKVGQTVNYGEPLIVMAKEKEKLRNQVHRARDRSFADASETWDHHTSGIVTDVEKTKKGVNVVVKTLMPMQVADKISGRQGNKGVVHIVPDSEMPTDINGRPFEVLMPPHVMTSRVNPTQIHETLLGKIVEKTGVPYKLADFDKISDLTEFVGNELKKHGLKDRDEIIDPSNGRRIPDILTGNMFIVKLHHVSESKEQGRGIGGYTAEGLPSRSGDQKAKRVSLMDVNAMLSHGVPSVIRDAGLIRGQAHPEYWQQVMLGRTPPPPKVPLVYRKFVDQLRAAGINVVRDGQKLNLMAMTNADVDQMAGDREIQHGSTVDWKGKLAPVPGGLFDEKITGGHGAKTWSKITLPEPMPNPVMADPIRRILNLTEKEFEAVLAGKANFREKSGPAAIKDALENLDVSREIDKAREVIRSGRKSYRDDAVKKLTYLKSAQKMGLHPKDWMIDRVPVLPPIFRPVSLMQQTKTPLVADVNFLYKELLDARDNFKQMKDKVGDLGEERLAIYNSLKAVTGLGDPVHQENRDRGVTGVLKNVFGSSPKYGVLQRKLIGSAVDTVGRSTLLPNPDLDMDQAGIPEDKAWDVYRPFIVRDLVRSGMPVTHAMRQVQDRTKPAREALLRELDRRPVIVTRAPVLHRFGVMAFWPKLLKSNSIQLPPMVFSGYGADSCRGTELVQIAFNTAQLLRIAECIPAGATRDKLLSLTDPGNTLICRIPIADFPRDVDNVRISPRGVAIYKVPEGVSVMSYSADANKAGLFAVDEFSIHPDCDGVEVTTKGKRKVGVSNDHSLYVLDDASGQMVRCSPSDAIGKAVVIAKMTATGFDIEWDMVEAIEPIETQTMYDLSVPATKVFAVNDGLVIYDSDGDALNYHVPVSENAVQEAIEKMLPSRNLFSPATFAVHQVPEKEYVGGLYAATKGKNADQSPQVFVTKADAARAYRNGEIDLKTPIEILRP